MKPGAPIKSLKNKHVLDRVYRTDRGDGIAGPTER